MTAAARESRRRILHGIGTQHDAAVIVRELDELAAASTAGRRPAPLPPALRNPSGKYDPARRRQAVRRGRERGCWIYLPWDEIAKTDWPHDVGPPHYRVWGAPRGRVVVQLYKTGP